FAISLIINGCQKEIIVLPAPKIEITSFEESAFGEFHAEISIDLGEGQSIKGAELRLEDITVESEPPIIKKIELSEERKQTRVLTISEVKINHDYKTFAVIKTENYEYVSEIKIMRASKNHFIFEVVEDPYFANPAEKISDYVSIGEKFTAIFYFQSNIENKNLEIRLDRNIKLNHNLILDGNYSENRGFKEVYGEVEVPMVLEPKEYDVYAYVDDVEIKAAGKIKVLSARWNLYNDDFPGSILEEKAWFLVDDELFTVQNYYSSVDRSMNFPVYKFNLANNSWTRVSNFENYELGEYQHKVLPYNIQYNSNGYLFFNEDNESIKLFTYDKSIDSWSFVTEYPGSGIWDHVVFCIGNNLFVGGGSHRNFNGPGGFKEFWVFNFDTKVWKQLNNFPSDFLSVGTSSCSGDKSAYIFESEKRLWNYEPETDQWKLMNRFPGIERIFSSLVLHNNEVYVIGGYQNNGMKYSLWDCWKYSLSEEKWELHSFLPHASERGIVFNWNSKIHYGMGYHTNWNHDDITNIYTLNEN
ncbi:MAG: kelch repeat-containing protein, partial [bacterium]